MLLIQNAKSFFRALKSIIPKRDLNGEILDLQEYLLPYFSKLHYSAKIGLKVEEEESDYDCHLAYFNL